MPKFDVARLNDAVDRLLDVTGNPGHRFILQAYSRHRYLDVAGCYEEIFAADIACAILTPPSALYRFNGSGPLAASPSGMR